VELEYATHDLERTCTDERVMKKKLGVQVSKSLKLRITELRRAREFDDLRWGVGRWEQLSGDRGGQWSARLTGNWRLIVRPLERDLTAVLVLEIVDYHRR